MPLKYSWFIKNKKDCSKKVRVLGSQYCFFTIGQSCLRGEIWMEVRSKEEMFGTEGISDLWRARPRLPWRHLPGMCYYDLTPWSINSYFLWGEKKRTGVIWNNLAFPNLFYVNFCFSLDLILQINDRREATRRVRLTRRLCQIFPLLEAWVTWTFQKCLLRGEENEKQYCNCL